jgi:RNA polymerase sigma-70 factor (subfamily 1)
MDSFRELLAKAQAGLPEAWDQFWTQYGPHLLRVARSRLSRRLQAKTGGSDLVQLTFLKAHAEFPHFHGTTECELRAWFKQILLHNIADIERQYLQAGKRQLAVEEALVRVEKKIPATTPSPPAEAVEQEELEAFRRALETLGQRDRQIIRLRMQEHDRFDQIGPQMGLSEAGARSLWYRAIKRLARRLEFFCNDR